MTDAMSLPALEGDGDGGAALKEELVLLEGRRRENRPEYEEGSNVAMDESWSG